MKGTDSFKKVISDHLASVAAADPKFAEKMANPKKSIDDCINYILNTVQNSGCNGFADAEIFGMALHYYDEEDIKPGAKVNCNVVVNHTVDLSEEEKQQAKERALKEFEGQHLRELQQSKERQEAKEKKKQERLQEKQKMKEAEERERKIEYAKKVAAAQPTLF